MRLYGVRIFVDDFPRARAFYRETLGLAENWSSPDLAAAGFDVETGELIVEAEAADGPHADLIGRFIGVSLQVPDIDATHRALLDHGVVFESPPQKQAWGGTLAHFRDPAGNVLTLLQ